MSRQKHISYKKAGIYRHNCAVSVTEITQRDNDLVVKSPIRMYGRVYTHASRHIGGEFGERSPADKYPDGTLRFSSCAMDLEAYEHRMYLHAGINKRMYVWRNGEKTVKKSLQTWSIPD